MNKVLLIMAVYTLSRCQHVKGVKPSRDSKPDSEDFSRTENQNSVLKLKEELLSLRATHKSDMENLEKKLEMKISNYKIDWSSGKENRLEDVEDNLVELEDVISTLKSNFQTFKNVVNTEIKELKDEKSKSNGAKKQSGSWQEDKLYSYINDLQEESLATRLKFASHRKLLENLQDSQDTLTKSISKIHLDYLSLVLKIVVLQGSSNRQNHGNRSLQVNHGFIASHTKSRTLTKGIVPFNKVFYNSGYFDLTNFKFICPQNGLYQVSLTICISDDSDRRDNAQVHVVMDILEKDDHTVILDTSGVYLNNKATNTRNVVCYTGESIWLLNTKTGALWADELHQCPTLSVMFLEET